ncbi:MAG: hypothetical protein CMJ82_09100, partial [Planctomycetaceae bacterium]|nr:hypothetical protein [Planctomycetaceae bacterium]
MARYIKTLVCTLILAIFNGELLAQPQTAGPPKPVTPTNVEYEIGKKQVITRLELNDSTVLDATRLISEVSGINVVATQEAGIVELSLFLRHIKTIDAIETLCKVAGLWYREEEEVGLVRIMTTEEYGKDLVIYREEDTRVFTLLHPNVFSIAQHIQDLYGERVLLSLPRYYDDQFLATAGQQSQQLMMIMQMMGAMGGGGGGMGMGGMGMGGFGGTSAFGGGGSFGRMGGFGMGMGGFGMGMGGFGMGMGGMGMGMGGGGPQQNTINYEAVNRRDELLNDETLTADQIQALGNQGAVASGSTSSERIQEVTSQEPPIHVAINQTHGMIIVRTSDKVAMDSIATLIEQLDRPTPQVLLEVRILEVTLGDQFKSAFDFEFSQNKTTPAVGDPAFVPSNLVNTATEQFIGPGASYLDNGGSALGSGNFDVEADGSTFVYQFLDQNFRARVQLLEEENRVNVIATPILLASNNRPASLRIGEERRFTDSASTITNANQGGQTVGTNIETSDQQIGTSLMMLPKINADRTVTLTIFQERTGDDTGKQDIIPISATQTVTRPVVSNATTVNTVVAKDGLTVAIGGMVEEKVVKRQLKVPLLGDIPTLGALFRKDFEQEQKTELIILITPHVISTPKQSEK